MKYVRSLSIPDKAALNELMRTSNSFRVRRRAHVILLSARKYKIEQLAEIFDVDRDTISDWIKRWEKSGIAGLKDAQRSGRPKKEVKNKVTDK